MSPDLINALFELGGAAAICLSIRKAHQDKIVRGVSWPHTLFFSLWGLWNIIYYPSLGQTLSFLAGVVLLVCNLIWVGQLIYYTRQERANIG